MKTFMKKMNLFWSIVMVIFAFAACSTGDWYDDALTTTTQNPTTTTSTVTESDDDNSKSTSTADNVVLHAPRPRCMGACSEGEVVPF